MILGVDTWFVFFGWAICSLVSVVLFEYYKRVVAVGSQVESASEDRWVAEKNSDGLGEKAEGAVGKRWGTLPPPRDGIPRELRCGGRGAPASILQ